MRQQRVPQRHRLAAFERPAFVIETDRKRRREHQKARDRREERIVPRQPDQPGDDAGGEQEDEEAIEQAGVGLCRSEEHTSELQSLMRISYAVFCLKKKKNTDIRSRQK